MISDKNEKVNAKGNKVGSLEKCVIKNGLWIYDRISTRRDEVGIEGLLRQKEPHEQINIEMKKVGYIQRIVCISVCEECGIHASKM